MNRSQTLIVIAALLSLAASPVQAQEPPRMKMTTAIPKGIATPDRLETRIGTLTSVNGVPDKITVQKIYDNQTRAMLQTDQRFPGIDNNKPGMIQNKDGSYDIYFGPKAPKGQENNWVQTVPRRGWNMLFRLYGPLEPWFEKTWRPGEIELVE